MVADSKTMPLIAEENAEVTGEEHLERSTMNDDAGKLVRDFLDVLYSAQ